MKDLKKQRQDFEEGDESSFCHLKLAPELPMVYVGCARAYLPGSGRSYLLPSKRGVIAADDSLIIYGL